MRPSGPITMARTPSVMPRAKRPCTPTMRCRVNSIPRRSAFSQIAIILYLAAPYARPERVVKGSRFLFRILLIMALVRKLGAANPNDEADVKRFAELTEQEILALAISNEEEDSRIYRGFAEGLRAQYGASAKVFDEMAEEEVHHRTMLFDLYRSKFGDYLPLIRRQDVKGFGQHTKPLWLVRPLGLDEVRKYAETMEYETARFYRKAAV